jgi:hypothetical protein
MLWYPNFCQKKLRNFFAAIAVALVLTPKIDNYMQLHSYHGTPPDSSMTSGLGLSARLISVLLELSDNRLDEHQQHVQIQHHRRLTASASGLTPFSIRDMQIDRVCRSRSAFWKMLDRIDVDEQEQFNQEGGNFVEDINNLPCLSSIGLFILSRIGFWRHLVGAGGKDLR